MYVSSFSRFFFLLWRSLIWPTILLIKESLYHTFYACEASVQIAELLFCFLMYNSLYIHHQTGEVHIVCGNASLYPSINAFSKTLTLCRVTEPVYCRTPFKSLWKIKDNFFVVVVLKKKEFLKLLKYHLLTRVWSHKNHWLKCLEHGTILPCYRGMSDWESVHKHCH